MLNPLQETEAERLLRMMATGELPRNETTLKHLSGVIEHPSELANSSYLAEDDPLRVEALSLLDDFEAITNGMKEPGLKDFDENSPLYPWQLLCNAVASFYEGDFSQMKSISALIPEDSAPHRLSEVFDNLAGKPVGNKSAKRLADIVFTQQLELKEGLDLLEEASFYPHLLRDMAPSYLKLFEAQDRETAQRLCLWMLSVLAEANPLDDNDISLISPVFGKAEAARLVALSSIPYDPDRALLSWLRSLYELLVDGTAEKNDVLARLSIAVDLWRNAQDSGLLDEQLSARIREILVSTFPMLNGLIPSLSPIPDTNEKLYGWLTTAARFSISKHPEKSLSTSGIRGRRNQNLQGLLLFDEVK